MIRSGQCARALVVAFVLMCFAWTAGASAQQTAQEPSQPPLGDVARRQRQQPKTAKLVVSDDDLPLSHTHRITGTAAMTKMIPYITFTGVVPDSITVSTVLDPKQKIHVLFGPEEVESCFDLDGAETTYLQKFPKIFGGTVRVLFDSNETIQGYPSRVARIEIIHDVLGKVAGSVVFVRVPMAMLTATCVYRAEDRAEGESDCKTYIDSLEINVPKKYIGFQGYR
jgi:hypothetical protein